MDENYHVKIGEVGISYEKPLFEKQTGMVFPDQIIERHNGGRFCIQCSSCHGCR